MKSDLMTLFGDQLRWFTRLNRKQRLCVLYFCLSFGILLSVVFDHPIIGLGDGILQENIVCNLSGTDLWR